MGADGMRYLALAVVAIVLICAVMAVFIITIDKVVTLIESPSDSQLGIVVAVISIGAAVQQALAPVLTNVVNRLMNGEGKEKGIGDG